MTNSFYNWTEKYTPKKFTDLIYKDDVHLSCLKIFSKLHKSSVLVIIGPVGVGKSTLIKVLCNLCNYNIINQLSNDRSLNNKKNICVIEDVDQSYSIPKSTKGCPIIITSTHNLSESTSKASGASQVEYIHIKKHEYEHIKAIVERIQKTEFIDCRLLSRVASNCDFDVRSILNNLQANNKCVTSKTTYNHYDIFKKHIRWSHFDKFSVNFVYSAYISEATIESSEAFSLFDILGDNYYCIPLSRVNRRRHSNIQIIKNTGNRKQVSELYNYDSLLNLKTESERNIQYLQESVKKKCIALPDEDTERIRSNNKGLNNKNLDPVPVEALEYKYKYKKGVSNFCKQYITLDEFLDL